MTESPIHQYYKKLIQQTASQPIFIQTKPSATPNNTPNTPNTPIFQEQTKISLSSTTSDSTTISPNQEAIQESLESYVDVIEENVQLYDELQTVIFEKESCHSKELIERILDVQEDIVRMNLGMRVLLQEIRSGEPIQPSEREPRPAMTAEEKMGATLQYIGYYMLNTRNGEGSNESS